MPACLKTVLEYYGITESEATLRIKCKSRAIGTHPLNAVECAKGYGLESYFDSVELDELRSLLKANIPPIVNIMIFDAEPPSLHSVILTRITKRDVDVIDPESGRSKIPLHEFNQVWEAAEKTVIVIKKSS